MRRLGVLSRVITVVENVDPESVAWVVTAFRRRSLEPVVSRTTDHPVRLGRCTPEGTARGRASRRWSWPPGWSRGHPGYQLIHSKLSNSS
jgi:hypothetical protein